MPERPTKGTKGTYFEVPHDLLARLDARAESQGRTRRQELLRALVRHLDHPEPDRADPPPADLPRAAPSYDPVPPPKKRGRKPRT